MLDGDSSLDRGRMFLREFKTKGILTSCSNFALLLEFFGRVRWAFWGGCHCALLSPSCTVCLCVCLYVSSTVFQQFLQSLWHGWEGVHVLSTRMSEDALHHLD